MYNATEKRRLGVLRSKPGAVKPKDEELLLKAVSDSRTTNKFALVARRALIALGKELSDDGIDALISLATKGDLYGHASEVLGKLGARAAKAVDRLLGAARGSSLTAVPAVLALGKLGPHAKPAVPQLRQWLKGEEGAELAAAAATALYRIGDPSPPTVRVLLAGLESPHGSVVAACAKALGSMQVLKAVSPLMGLIRPGTRKSGQQKAGARALGAIGRPANRAMPALIRLLADDNAEVQLAAIVAMGQIGTHAATAVPALVETLAADGRKAPSLRSLASYGREAQQAVNQVVLCLDSRWRQDPRIAAETLAAIDFAEASKLLLEQRIREGNDSGLSQVLAETLAQVLRNAA